MSFQIGELFNLDYWQQMFSGDLFSLNFLVNILDSLVSCIQTDPTAARHKSDSASERCSYFYCYPNRSGNHWSAHLVLADEPSHYVRGDSCYRDFSAGNPERTGTSWTQFAFQTIKKRTAGR